MEWSASSGLLFFIYVLMYTIVPIALGCILFVFLLKYLVKRFNIKHGNRVVLIGAVVIFLVGTGIATYLYPGLFKLGENKPVVQLLEKKLTEKYGKQDWDFRYVDITNIFGGEPAGVGRINSVSANYIVERKTEEMFNVYINNGQLVEDNFLKYNDFFDDEENYSDNWPNSKNGRTPTEDEIAEILEKAEYQISKYYPAFKGIKPKITYIDDWKFPVAIGIWAFYDDGFATLLITSNGNYVGPRIVKSKDLNN